MDRQKIQSKFTYNKRNRKNSDAFYLQLISNGGQSPVGWWSLFWESRLASQMDWVIVNTVHHSKRGRAGTM